MRWLGRRVLLVAVWGNAASLLVGCASPSPDPATLALQAWPAASKAGTTQALNEYIARFPDSPHAGEAISKLRVLERHAAYKRAFEIGTPAALEKVLADHPAASEAPGAYDALQRLFVQSETGRMEREWAAIGASDAVASLVSFVQRHPNSPHVQQARERMQRIAPDPGFADHIRGLAKIDAEGAAENKSSRGDPTELFGFYPALSAEPSMSLIFKDRSQRYQRIVLGSSKPSPLGPGDEYTQLRGVAPFAGFILLIDQAHVTAPQLLWDDFGRLFAQFGRERCSGQSPGCETVRKVSAPIGHRNYPHKNSAVEHADLWVQIARSQPAFGLRVDAQSPARFEDSAFAVEHLARLRALTGSADRGEVLAGVVAMLHVPGERSTQALYELGAAQSTALVEALSNPSAPVAARARQVLLRQGPLAVPELILALDASASRQRAISVLGQIRDPRSASRLAQLLRTRDAGPAAASALRAMSWQPQTDVERVDWWIATRNRGELTRQYSLARDVLVGSIARQPTLDVDSIQALIAIGHPDSVPELVALLNRRGEEGLASLYLNCGNKTLSDAGASWLRSRGYQLMPNFTMGPPTHTRWGRQW